MSSIVARLFDSSAKLDAAIDRLKKNRYHDIQVIDRQKLSAGRDDVVASLAKRGLSSWQSQGMLDDVARGKILVTVRAPLGARMAGVILDSFVSAPAPASSRSSVSSSSNKTASKSSATPFSDIFGLAVLSKDATPFSRFLGLPVLSEERPSALAARAAAAAPAKPAAPVRQATFFSSIFGLPLTMGK